MQSLPARDDSPWKSGNTNGRFDGARGLGFDSAGRMYVSDSNNHRVQVYDMSTSSPVYSTTIGVTGVYSSTDGYFNYPYRIAVDTSNRLYVVDYGNNRVQQCIYSSATWSCTTFDSGLNDPQGIAVDSSNNVYISETGNGRVLKCDSGGSCSDLVTNNPEYDVAVDSDGNIFGVDWNDKINKRDSNGWNAVTFVGVVGIPYLTDNYHYFQPRAAIDHSDNILILEGSGQRLIKLNSNGVALWSIGVPGVNNSDNSHFSWPRDLVADPNGDIYVADTNNDRIQKCASDGSGCALFAGVSAEAGSDNGHFNQPSGIAMDGNGNIYVGDQSNHRVQKCTSLGVCTTFAGVAGESGTDNMHFNGPSGIAVDGTGNVYVADTWNNRVQKCTSAGSCSTFAGVTGAWNNDFGHFGEPWCVTLDAQGRVYITDNWNNRVQVFSSDGAYLTTIGGAWGIQTGQFRASWGVALDSKEDVYIGNFWDSRIQKFAPGVPGWKQANINGFGNCNNWAAQRMSVWGNYLYVGAANDNTGGEVWRTVNGTDWSQVNLDGFGMVSNTSVLVGDAFNGYLYAGTANSPTGAEIWRCATCDGTDWTRVITGGFDDGNNHAVERILVFSNTLYATTNNSATGVEVWKSPTGNPGSWTQSNVDGFGDAKNTGLWAAAVFNGYLYVATAQWDAYFAGTYTGLEVWRTSDGVTWGQVNTDGFGSRDNISPWMEPFNGYLYVQSFNFQTGAQVWRCATCDGTDWALVVSDGFGDGNNAGGSLMLGFDNHFYVFTHNDVTGTEVWQTTNGVNWSQVSVDGLGDSNNTDVQSGAVFNNRLFIGTLNDANGGEVWQMLHQVYLPVVLRN